MADLDQKTFLQVSFVIYIYICAVYLTDMQCVRNQPPVCVCAAVGPKVLSVLGRDVILKKTSGSIADCSFEELCVRVSVSAFRVTESTPRGNQ